MKRAVATFTVYIYGDNEQEMFNEAKRIERKILDLDDNRASLDKLTIAPFGADGIDPKKRKEIDIELHQHYFDSYVDYMKSGIEGESHLEYYRDKHPVNFERLKNLISQ